mmetsp:Transcript_72775/g.121493  ORF Transcript_72775/g.121493 Transcript_72775/m.121493 type:complete len:326 (+) Transcript_72775:101-1078(+)
MGAVIKDVPKNVLVDVPDQNICQLLLPELLLEVVNHLSKLRWLISAGTSCRLLHHIVLRLLQPTGSQSMWAAFCRDDLEQPAIVSLVGVADYRLLYARLNGLNAPALPLPRKIADIQFMLQLRCCMSDFPNGGGSCPIVFSASLPGGSALVAGQLGATNCQEPAAGLAWQLPNCELPSIAEMQRAAYAYDYASDGGPGGLQRTWRLEVTAFRAADQKLCRIIKDAFVLMGHGHVDDSVTFGYLRFNPEPLCPITPSPEELGPDDVQAYVKASLVPPGAEDGGAWHLALYFYESAINAPPDEADEQEHWEWDEERMLRLLRQMPWA